MRTQKLTSNAWFGWMIHGQNANADSNGTAVGTKEQNRIDTRPPSTYSARARPSLGFAKRYGLFPAFQLSPYALDRIPGFSYFSSHRDKNNEKKTSVFFRRLIVVR